MNIIPKRKRYWTSGLLPSINNQIPGCVPNVRKRSKANLPPAGSAGHCGKSKPSSIPRAEGYTLDSLATERSLSSVARRIMIEEAVKRKCCCIFPSPWNNQVQSIIVQGLTPG